MPQHCVHLKETKEREPNPGPKIDRRRFLQLTSGGLALCAAGPRLSFASPYRVGVGHRTDPYKATIAAIKACGEWPSTSVADRTVVIKPNLIADEPADAGITTDPEVVRALVDLALRDGAKSILIVEGSQGEAPFSACGYDFFSTYDPSGRVQLVDLNDQPEQLVKVPKGLAYRYLYMPECVMRNDVFFISAGKLKTHSYTLVTLSMKNLVGLTRFDRYVIPSVPYWRAGLHERGIHQTIPDLNMIRPIDFAVIDGIWGMEGFGPTWGDPIRMNLAFAGRNSLAVDRVCLEAMGISQQGVQYLQYASRKSLGPSTLSEISILGDSFTPHSFVIPNIPPAIGKPYVSPLFFSPGTEGSLNILYTVSLPPCIVQMDIVRAFFYKPEMTQVRRIHDWTSKNPGWQFATWDGRDDNGQIVTERGRYGVRITAKDREDALPWICAFSWIHVV